MPAGDYDAQCGYPTRGSCASKQYVNRCVCNPGFAGPSCAPSPGPGRKKKANDLPLVVGLVSAALVVAVGMYSVRKKLMKDRQRQRHSQHAMPDASVAGNNRPDVPLLIDTQRGEDAEEAGGGKQQRGRELSSDDGGRDRGSSVASAASAFSDEEPGREHFSTGGQWTAEESGGAMSVNDLDLEE